MPKAYWITVYREVRDPEKLAAYAKLAAPATKPFGAKYLARGTAQMAYEHGQKERVVITEFPSLEQAIARHEPRLTHVRVMLQVDGRATSVLYFAITAMLDVGPAHEPVTFDATLQPSTLQYSVTKGWAKRPATV